MTTDSPTDLSEPLQDNAIRVFANGIDSCSEVHGCSNYHRLWPLARLARESGTQLAGADFFKQQLLSFPKASQPRILICGAADTGVLAMLVNGARSAGLDAHFVLADRCATVIDQNRLLAEHWSLSLECHQTDLTLLNCEAVDLIVAHSLLGFFSNSERQLLFNNWQSLLSRSGAALISNLVHQQLPDNPPLRRSLPNPARIQEVARSLGFTSIQLEELSDMLDRGWQFNQNVFQAPLETQLTEQIQQASFQVAIENRYSFEGGEKGPLIVNKYSNSQRVEMRLEHLD